MPARIIAATGLVWTTLLAGVATAQLAPLPSQMKPATELVGTRPGDDPWLQARRWNFEPPATAMPGPPTFPASQPVALPPVAGAPIEGLPVVEVLPFEPSGTPIVDPSLWHWQIFPDGILYKAYLAGTKESRIATQIFYERDEGWLWDSTLGGRAAVLRYGNDDAIMPEGWQVDVEGAAFPRLDPQENMDLTASDFRIGVPVAYGYGPWRMKLAYYHLSSHYGDEFLLRTGTTTRFNYSRDAIVMALAYYATPDVRIYGEADWGVIHIDVGELWAFQFGAEYSPARPTGIWGAPFMAVNGHLRQEIDFSGNLVVQAGWQWRGHRGDLLRVGGHYYNGLSPEFELFNQFEEQFGLGFWYDF